MPALKAPRGVKRLRALFENWVAWPQRASLPGGCPIDAASREYDHKPGPMRDAVIDRQRQLDRELTKAVQLAVETGEFAPNTNAKQVAFEFLALVLAFYRGELVLGLEDSRKYARAAFERLLESNRR